MTHLDFLAMLPLLIAVYAGVVLMLIVPFTRSNSVAFWFTAAALLAVCAFAFSGMHVAPHSVAGLLSIDSFALFFTALVGAGAILVAMLSRDYFPCREARQGPFYILLLFAVAGMAVVASSTHFATFFLAYETLSVSLFGLIGYTRRFKPALEGAIKYLVLAAISSAFMLLGIGLLYSIYGTLVFADLLAALRTTETNTVALLGLGFLLVGIGFKLSVVPFHMWSPDVYQGAPSPVTALIATGSKAAVFAVLMRLVIGSGLMGIPSAFLLFAVLATATMFAGNLLALQQNNIKRLLAYSSIAQIGYLFIPLLSGGAAAASAVGFYFVSYFATTVAAFGVVCALSAGKPGGDLERIEDYRGLAASRPVMAGILSMAMLSLMGLPLTSGFFGKLYLFLPAAQTGLWWLLIVGVVNSGISAFYYLRVVFAVFASPAGEQAAHPAPKPLTAAALAISSAVVLFFGVYPTPLIRMAEAAMRLVSL